MEMKLYGCCLTDNVVKELYNKEIFVFGAGTCGEDFLKLYQNDLRISAYIDNSKSGYTVNGIDIISIQDFINKRTNESRIIITTEYYSFEIARQLMEKNLNPEVDFYIWDPKGIYHLDENTKKYIEFNKSLWKKYKRKNTNRKILIPFMRSQDTGATMYSYIGNYLAEKYDAEIVAYVRGGRARNTISESIRLVYESFNTTDVITPELDLEKRLEVQRLLDEVWPKIKTMADWHDINLYGIPIGTVIVQNYLRYEMVCFDYNEKNWYDYLKKAISVIVYWYHWFQSNDVKTVILLDWGIYDGYMRDIACYFGIPVYCVYYTVQGKLSIGYSQSYVGQEYTYYKKFWKSLTVKEQQFGVEWAKDHLSRRFAGYLTDVNYGAIDSPFTKKTETRLTENSDRIKVMICPHIFEEDPIGFGWQIFGNYVTWLNYLGELSEKTDYDWYLKEHPAGSNRDRIFIDNFCKKYKKIKKLPIKASPEQLAQEGIKFAFTVHGTLGHEYPLLGINVINAGNNPHIAFDFDYNPRTKEEFDELVYNLDTLKREINIEEIYQYYSIHYLYYKHEGSECWKNFFLNPKLVGNEIDSGSWKYQAFMDEWSQQRHQEILQNVEKLLLEMDMRKVDYFYRK